jgi:hypothetical protein
VAWKKFCNMLTAATLHHTCCRYRRLTMWLPHGLAANTQLSAIEPLINICAFSSAFDESSACKDLDFQLSRPSKGTLQAAVPVLSPKQHYRVTVKADAKVSPTAVLRLF